MQKNILKTITIFSFVTFNLIFSQESKIHVGLVYPISSNGKNAPSISNQFSLHAIAGISKNENSIAISGVTNIIKENAKGVQIAGVSNHIGENGRGLAVAGIINKVGNNYSGVQISGVINQAKIVKGVQIAGVINIADESKYPIAILNFIKNGEKYFSVKYDYLGNIGITFNSGYKTYGILGASYNHKIEKVLSEAGLGYQFNINSKFLLRNEIIFKSAIANLDNQDLFVLRFSPSGNFKLGKSFEIFAGPVLDYIKIDNINYHELLSNNNLWKKDNKQLQLGYLFGINLFL